MSLVGRANVARRWPGRLVSCDVQVWRRGFILRAACDGGSHSDPSSSPSLPGKSFARGRWWFGESCLAAAPCGPSQVPPPEAPHSPDSRFPGSRYLGRSNHCPSALSSFRGWFVPPECGQSHPSVILSEGGGVANQHVKSQRLAWGVGSALDEEMGNAAISPGSVISSLCDSGQVACHPCKMT